MSEGASPARFLLPSHANFLSSSGINCLETPHSAGVGCSAGACVIFSCKAGYKPNAAATGCQKVAPTARHRRGRSKRSHATPHIH